MSVGRFVPTAAILFGAATSAAAQTFPARSSEYLFLTNVADARALWVNPAGLGLVPEASLLGEVSVDRNGSDLRLEQWSVGVSSRGLSFGYQRNRHAGESSVTSLRFGFGVPLRRGAVGLSLARFAQDSTSGRELNVGAIFIVSPLIQLGTAVRHVGRPTIRNQEMPVTGVGAVQLSASQLQATWESAIAEDRVDPTEDFQVRHRGGLRFAIGRAMPLVVVGTVDLASNFEITQLTFGLSVGGTRRVIGMTTAVSQNSRPVLERFSLALLATDPIAVQ